MSAPSAFTLDSVLQFMVDNGGKVTNHELVRHFKFFLTDPVYKDNARAQFKQFVNTLATIKVEHGEKYLLLKRQFRVSPPPPPSSTHPSADYGRPSVSPPHGRAAPPPYRPPPLPRALYAAPSNRLPPPPQLTGPRFRLPAPVGPSVETPRHAATPAHQPVSYLPHQQLQHRLAAAPCQRRPLSVSPHHAAVSVRHQAQPPQQQQTQPPAPATAVTYRVSPLAGGVVCEPQPLGLPPPPPPPPPVMRESRATLVAPPRRHQSLDERRLSYCERDTAIGRDEDKGVSVGSEASSLHESSARMQTDSDSGSQHNPQQQHQQQQQQSLSQRNVSVREHAQLFNRIASETQLLPPSSWLAAAAGHDRRHGHQLRPYGGQASKNTTEDDDTASTVTTEAFCKEWCLASSSSTYMQLVRLLKENPRLARQKDSITTALHWAAKHGSLDTIKLLAGTHAVDVHCRTGSTPLHLAFQYGHHDAADLLVHTYGADEDMRDYSGKKPRQYAVREASRVTRDITHKMTKRKNSERDNGFLRIGSLNVRVKRTSGALNSLLTGGGGSVQSRNAAPVSENMDSSSMPVSSSLSTLMTSQHSGGGGSGSRLSSRYSLRKVKSQRGPRDSQALKSRISAPILSGSPSSSCVSVVAAAGDVALRRQSDLIARAPDSRPDEQSDNSDAEYGFGGQQWNN